MTDDEKTEFMIKLITNKKKGGSITEWAKLGNTIVGTLVGDKFEPIQTSSVVKIHTVGDQLIAETRNSYYYLFEEGTAFTFQAKLTLYQQENARRKTHYE
jgi:hypothetical protein